MTKVSCHAGWKAFQTLEVKISRRYNANNTVRLKDFLSDDVSPTSPLIWRRVKVIIDTSENERPKISNSTNNLVSLTLCKT